MTLRQSLLGGRIHHIFIHFSKSSTLMQRYPIYSFMCAYESTRSQPEAFNQIIGLKENFPVNPSNRRLRRFSCCRTIMKPCKKAWYRVGGILVLVGLVLAHEHDSHERCGTDHTLPKDLMARDQARMKRIVQHDSSSSGHDTDGGRLLQKKSCTELCDGCITIDLYVALSVSLSALIYASTDLSNQSCLL